jgi:energy-coupling factor transport system ATP-binding protein
MIPRPVTDGGPTIISLGDVKFTYDGGVEALKGVTLNIKKGEYVAVVGGNGSGKTTLAKQMNGLLRPGGGTVTIGGRPAAPQTVAELSRVVGYVFQNPDHQLFSPSVEEEVLFGPENIGYSGPDSRNKAEHAMALMGIGHLRKEPPLSLNLGARRKVTIASVLAMSPQVLVLDEPTTGLDDQESRDLMAGIDGLNKQGLTVILITHEMKIVAEHANRVVVMAEGRIVLDSDVKGAFADIELLRQSKLVPPPITLLAHRLSAYGISRDVLSTDEFVFEASKIIGGSR